MNGLPMEPSGDIRVTAGFLQQQRVALVEAGFSVDEAFELVKIIATAMFTEAAKGAGK